MKIQFLTTYYPPFLKTFYAEYPDFNSLNFNEMLNALLAQYFADTGALFHYSIKHNNNCFLIIANCEPLQKKWAAEHEIQFDVANWQKDIAMAQIKWFQPDVFYIESIFDFYGDFLHRIKKYCKTVVAWISTPINDDLKLNDIDLIVSSTPDFVEKFRKRGIKSEYMLPAFDVRIIELLNQSDNKDIMFSFVGGWSHLHVNRKKALKELVKALPIQLWGYGFKKGLYSRKSINYYKELLLPIEKEILKAYQGELWGLEMYAVLKRSLITFNIHESLLNGKVGNMRMFEATGVGTLIMNDYGSNLSQIFVPEKEIEVYKSIDEAIEKTKYYFENPQKAIEIGRNAQQRTIKDYNYDLFVSKLISHINSNL